MASSNGIKRYNGNEFYYYKITVIFLDRKDTTEEKLSIGFTILGAQLSLKKQQSIV